LKISDGGSGEVSTPRLSVILILWTSQILEVGKVSRGKGFQEKGLETSQTRAMANSKVTRRFQKEREVGMFRRVQVAMTI
jgi:hypothetical protein